MSTYYNNLGSVFIDVASNHAQRVCLNYPDHTISYAELEQSSARIASFLLEKKLKQGDVIAIGSCKFFLSYALMIACIRLGVTYVNLDVNAPTARNLRIMEVSGAKFLFYDNPVYELAMQELAVVASSLSIELNFETLPTLSSQDFETQRQLIKEVDGSTIAYIMFTSGSTGIPKGVAVTHQNLLHFISWGKTCFNIKPEDNFAQLSPMYFDNSVFDFYVGLFSGASLTPIYRELLTSPYELVTYVGNKQCSVWFSVPSLLIYLAAMKALNSKVMPQLRSIVFGGEGYPKQELKKLFDEFSAQASLINVYGPTECTCICSAYFLSDSDFNNLEGLPPLGKLNINFDYKILDEDEIEATKGELCLIGPNVAAGYFNDFERTAASFKRVSDSRRFMKPMYKTGDIVEEVNGMLYFIGRKDNQIKHMGYRIELEEIEHALAKLPNINQVAVVYHRTNTAYGKILAFAASSESLDEQMIMSQLAEFLPDYMIPNRVFVKTTLPKNPNGKVDRQQLMIKDVL